MKKLFPGYYRPTEEEFSTLWETCFFVLDTNVLLNLYRYSQETSKELLKILKQISVRLWIPHQAALEYQKNRLETISKQLDEYDKIQNLVEKSKKDLENGLNSLGKRHPYIKVDSLMEIMRKACKEIEKNLKKLKKKHPDLLQHDNLRDILNALLKDKIGSPYSQKKLEEIYKLGKKRYQQEIPPGFKDKDKDGIRKYGDLVLWFQIIDKAKKSNKSIILITDDRKEDWWTKLKGKTVGPRPELVGEMISKANKSFYLYQTDPFMENAQKFLKQEIKKKAIDEVRGIRERDEKRERSIIEKTIDTTKLADSLNAVGALASSIKLSDNNLWGALDNARSSLTLSNDTLNATRAVNNLTPSLNLTVNNDTLRALQAANNSVLALGKYFGKLEDVNKLYVTGKTKESNKNEIDAKKEE